MDAMSELFEVTKQWVDLQAKTGQDWFTAMQNMKEIEPGMVWEKTVDSYQASIQGTLDAEGAGAEVWFKAVATLPGMSTELVEPVHDFSKQFINLQQKAVDYWFDFLRGNKFYFKITTGPVAEAAPVVEVTAA